MLLHLRPGQLEALTVTETALTRWSLANHTATMLAQESTAPWEILRMMYLQDGQQVYLGAVACDPDGECFALERPRPWLSTEQEPCVIELRRWDDFMPSRSLALSGSLWELTSLAISPDARWIVAESGERIYLADYQAGSVSHCVYGSTWTTGLIFDPTSRFVAGVRSADGGGDLRLWRLDPVEHYVPRPLSAWEQDFAPPDRVTGGTALTDVYGPLDRVGVPWPDRDLADTVGQAIFTYDSRMVIFSLRSAYCPGGYELVAYEVATGRRLWCAHGPDYLSGQFVLTPDGHHILAPAWDGNLHMFDIETGEPMQKLFLGLTEPVRALAFDQDGKTLWMATEHALQPYQPQV